MCLTFNAVQFGCANVADSLISFLQVARAPDGSSEGSLEPFIIGLDELRILMYRLEQIYKASSELRLDKSKLQIKKPGKYTRTASGVQIAEFYLKDICMHTKCREVTNILCGLYAFFNAENRFFSDDDWVRNTDLNEPIDRAPGSQSTAIICFPEISFKFFCLYNSVFSITEKFCENAELKISQERKRVYLEHPPAAEIGITGREHDCEQPLRESMRMNSI